MPTHRQSAFQGSMLVLEASVGLVSCGGQIASTKSSHTGAGRGGLWRGSEPAMENLDRCWAAPARLGEGCCCMMAENMQRMVGWRS